MKTPWFLLPLFAGSLTAASAVSEPPPGFTALFNGRDLEGWFGHGTDDPRQLFALSTAELAAHHESTMADVRTHWTVQDGELVNDGHGLYLTTKKNFRDFELLIDYRTVAGADSGIYLRGIPQVQIWDTTEAGGKWEIGADKGSGGLWNNSPGAPGKDPSKLMDRPLGEWNAFRILMIGERVTIHLNGEKIVDDAVLENYFDRAIPAFPEGPIQLQTHGGEIRWRNVFVREIPAEEANAALAGKDAEGFTSLFDGKTLEGWQGARDSYEVVDGAIVCKAGKGGTLYAADEYADFIFRFEFQLPPGGNNGVAIRAPLEGDPAWEAFEIQILDDSAAKYAGLQPYQFHGSIYGLVPAQRGFLRPTGEWNFQEIICRGSRIQVVLNGSKIVDSDVADIDLSAHEGRIPKGVERKSGLVGFAGHNDPVRMRNVQIKRL